MNQNRFNLSRRFLRRVCAGSEIRGFVCGGEHPVVLPRKPYKHPREMSNAKSKSLQKSLKVKCNENSQSRVATKKNAFDFSKASVGVEGFEPPTLCL